VETKSINEESLSKAINHFLYKKDKAKIKLLRNAIKIVGEKLFPLLE